MKTPIISPPETTQRPNNFSTWKGLTGITCLIVACIRPELFKELIAAFVLITSTIDVARRSR